MILDNFKIGEDHISIEFEGKYLDIHNCFENIGIDLDRFPEKIKLKFIKSNGDWVKHDEIDGFELIFNSVIHFDSKDIDNDYPSEYIINDDKCLDQLGFTTQDVDIDFGVVVNVEDNVDYCLSFAFVTGRIYRIKSKNVKLIQLNLIDSSQ